MRAGNFGTLILEGIGDGLAVFFPGNDQVAACEFDVLQVILSEGDVILLGRIPQGVLDGFGLGGFYCGRFSVLLAGLLFGLLDGDLIAQGMADCIDLQIVHTTPL